MDSEENGGHASIVSKTAAGRRSRTWVTEADGANSTHGPAVERRCRGPRTAVRRPRAAPGRRPRGARRAVRPAAYCWTVAAPPPSRTCRSPAAARARSSAASIPSVTKWKVVPPAIGTGSRAWWVRTKTSWWNGGSSPHQPVQSSAPHGPRTGPNMLRPMIVAPMSSSPSALNRRSTSVASGEKIHSCSCSPPTPSGFSSPWRGAGARSRRGTRRSCARAVRSHRGRPRRGGRTHRPGWATGGTLAVRRCGPVHWPPGAADPATGVPRNLPRICAAVVRRAVPGPVQGTRGVAQLAEQRSPKPQAAGSSPVTPATAGTDRPTAPHGSGHHHEASEAQ